jgi:ribosomal protein L17
MHHGKHVRRLNRTSAHRRALFRNMVSALIKNERIETTLPKAKELKKIADKMITIGKKGDFNAKRSAMAYLRVSSKDLYYMYFQDLLRHATVGTSYYSSYLVRYPSPKIR